jgi:hypothetical protein
MTQEEGGNDVLNLMSHGEIYTKQGTVRQGMGG